MRTVTEQGAVELVAALKQAGYAAYLVGGYVRDSLLGRPISDIDIATSALPDQVIRLFPRTVPTGLAHGTVTVLHRGQAYEVTTFRKEEGYTGHRRPTDVHFIEDLTEDLRRRDFTMNAMAMDETGRVIDPFGGQADLQARLVRAVGNPRERFDEDALRMLRCIRFAAAYRFTIEEETWNALLALAPTFRFIAMERVKSELEKMIGGSDPYRGLCLLADTGLMDYCKRPLPLENASERLRQLKGSKRLPHLAQLSSEELRWTALCLELGLSPEEAGQLMSVLVFPNRTRRFVAQMIRLHMRAREWDSKERFVRDLLDAGKPMIQSWLLLAEWIEDCDGRPVGGAGAAREWLKEVPVAALDELAVDGGDLKALGLKGKAIGSELNRLLFEAAMGRAENRKEALLAAAKEQIKVGDIS